MTKTIEKISAHIQESINAKSKLLSSMKILENLEESIFKNKKIEIY